MKDFLLTVIMLAGCMSDNLGSTTVSTRQSQQSDQPVVISAVAPKFTAIALAAKAEGEVIVEVKINSKGDVVSAQSISGHPLLKMLSEQAAMNWRFAPTTDETVSVAKLTFYFHMVDSDAESLKEKFTPIFFPPYKVEIRGERFIISDPSVTLSRKLSPRKHTRRKRVHGNSR